MDELDQNGAEGAWAVGLVLHPHPDYGGNRFNPVVDALFRRLPTVGVSAARFDFSSSDPSAAAAQVRDAIAVLLDRSPDLPLLLAGYSFGADIAATVDDHRLAGWYLVAPPLRLVAADAMATATDRRPKGLAVPEWDQYSPPDRVRELTHDWVATTLTVVSGADHFLAGAASKVADDAVAWVEAALRPLFLP